jgi:hypothetical protein
MKKAIVLFFLLAAAIMVAQEKSTIVVKDSGTYSGVIVITAVMGGKTIELQCNQNSSACSLLKSGNYVLVQLPKNHGMYDCQNADVYAESADLSTAQKIGEYCLTQK